MTAEIVIMNREAVAVAADSALSIIGGETHRPQKILTSAVKIFSISPNHAICIMTFNYATFMGIPWETIIDQFRKKVSHTPFPHTADCAYAFIEYLATDTEIISSKAQENFFVARAYSYFRVIRERIAERTSTFVKDRGEASEGDRVRFARGAVAEMVEQLRAAPFVASMTEQDAGDLNAAYHEKIAKALEETFAGVPLDDETVAWLKSLPGLFFTKSIGTGDPLWQNYSGIVFTGFGTRDTFPSLVSFWIEGRFNQKVRHTVKRDIRIDFDTAAEIVPFAQHEVVDTFLSGIDPELEIELLQDFTSTLRLYTDSIIDRLAQLPEGEKTALKEEYQAKSGEIVRRVTDRLDDLRSSNFMPIVNLVTALPKSELAAMAESLVNLTTLKRKISLEAETVGGPVDVVVISKSDCLVWIKRKQYFPRDLNPFHPSSSGTGKCPWEPNREHSDASR
jgi:hypothetical protein